MLHRKNGRKRTDTGRGILTERRKNYIIHIADGFVRRRVSKVRTPFLKKPERAFAKGREALLRECIQAERSAALRGKGAKDRMRELKNDTREIR